MNPFYILLASSLLIILALSMPSYSALEIMVFLLFLSTIAIVGTNYFFGVNLTAILHKDPNPRVSVNIQPIPSKIPQVYHVQGQFDYSTAKEVCKSYGANLATLGQVKQAYDKGGEWCDYGWSDDQMVLYPTQQSSWERYQSVDKKKCGIPGINGGYNTFKKQRLGVNCFGIKPDGTMPLEPEKVDTKKVDAKSEYWKSQNLTIAPFNYTSWSV